MLVLHGLEGSVHSHYASGILACLATRGYRPVLMHFRGCSGTPNRLSSSYHAGQTRDLDYVARLLRQREPQTPLAALGFSLGGNALLKWLGEQGDKAPLQAAVAVSVPFLLEHAAQRLAQGLSRLYQAYLLHKLKRSLRLKQRCMSLPINPALDTLRSFRSYDDAVTAPLHGFADVDDYYQRCSCRPQLSLIQCPTLILQARDDPFMFPETIPRPEELSDQIRLEVSQRGGHVGFIQGPHPWRPTYWLEQRIPAFLDSRLSPSRTGGVDQASENN